MIITIARESGSGGYTVGAMLAKHYSIPIYDRDSLSGLAREQGIYDTMPMFFDELPAQGFLLALSMGASVKQINKPTAEAMMKLIGHQDCVIIGRCGNYIFRNRSPDRLQDETLELLTERSGRYRFPFGSEQKRLP